MGTPDLSPFPGTASGRRTCLLMGSVLGATLLWSYWPTLQDMAQTWSTDPHYSHGYLVPVFACILLWIYRHDLAAKPLQGSIWGLAVIAASLGLRLAGTYFYFNWFDAISIVPCAAGLFILAAGWSAFRVAWPAFAFLTFMVPLPYSVGLMLGLPLRQVATAVSTYLLQTMGVPAFADGNVIVIHDFQIGVVEACSGLNMLLASFAACTALAILIRRPLLDRLILVASAIPVALVVNIFRITITAILYVTVNGKVAHLVFHDVAGWLMMPIAILLILGEIWLLGRLLVPLKPTGPVKLAKPADIGRAKVDRPRALGTH